MVATGKVCSLMHTNPTGIGEVMELDEITIEPHGGKAHIFRSELSGEWYLRLLAANGEIIAATEGHKNLLDIRKLWIKYFPDFSLADETGEPV